MPSGPEKNIWVVVPTYNEANNIESLLPQIKKSAGEDSQILVVDDSSPDQTAAIARKISRKIDGIHVLTRNKKEGLGPAYCEGFAYALDRGAEVIIQIDADFSHNPEDIPRLLDEIEEAYLVIGSRYVPGGKIEGWEAGRKLLSAGGNLYARVVLDLGVRDLTSGLKCWRREALEEIPWSDCRGYGFQAEMTAAAIRSGLTFREVPITFTDRKRGHSKMSPEVILEAVWKLAIQRIKQA